ncbi:HGGxSTG domain-containing protein [Thiorhodococcus drewsii]|uniref:HGGxSTG domain-containing protein n=1 Tax=Thiorhodococcus drewsii TaxID=210408 RepID=UPI0009FF70C0
MPLPPNVKSVINEHAAYTARQRGVDPTPVPANETCGAKTRKGTPCKRRDIYSNGRCWLHGGGSTGPRTAEGKARSALNGRLGGRPRKRSP